MQQSYDGYLVGADRTKDLAVLNINAPKVRRPPFVGCFEPQPLGRAGDQLQATMHMP